MSAGVDGMTTLSPGMWASSASRLCECWLPEERPAPNWVRTVSAISAAPPVMNGSLAAWLSSWSKQTPRKSRYISSTTGRIPAMAAPTPRPMIAVSEIGVSRTRSPNSIGEPPGEPEDVAAGADVDAGDEHPVVCGELGLERGADGVHGAEHRCIAGGRRRLRPRRPGPHDEVGQRGRRAGWPAGGRPRPPRRARRPPRLERLDLVVPDAGVPSRPSCTSSGSRASQSLTSSGDR